ncbi:MAG: BirA family biotin operon repressor/biotin-[acetyl-CoA-carboxylase] ligase [Candidatus Paceibacteria bacterium]|jgi:BirA family biotin operon repressor/biotin-[acetyl-CoA-carboxylase] ligase
MQFQPIRHGVVDSTTERAFASLKAGNAQHGDLHVARGQSHGRGRQGNVWHSTPDEGLYMSLVLLPQAPPLRPAALTIAAGLALVEALTDLGLPPFSPTRPELKWPNDIMVDGAKICGTLTESRGFDPKRPHFVLGIGLNVRQLHFPPELLAERRVTSLAVLGLEVTIGDAEEAVLGRLGARLAQVRQDHRKLASDYLEASQLLGKTVDVQCGKDSWRGRVLGLSLSDGLELALPDGDTRHLPVEFIQAVVRAEGL